MRIFVLITILSTMLCGTTYADMPIPAPKDKDLFFENVEEIILVPTTSVDDLVGAKSDGIDYQKIALQTNEDLSAAIKGKVLNGKNVTITKYPSEPFRKDKYQNSKGLVLKLLVSYKTATIDGKKLYIGSVVPILWRAPEIANKQNSGFSENYTDLAFAENFAADSLDDFYVALNKANQAVAEKIIKWSSNQ